MNNEMADDGEPSELSKAFHSAGLTQKDLDSLIAYLSSLDHEMSDQYDEGGIDYESFIMGIFSLGDPSSRRDALEIISNQSKHSTTLEVMDQGLMPWTKR